MANKLAQAWVRSDTPLRELHTFGESFTNLKRIDFGGKSTFKNLSLFIKTKVLAVFKLGTFRFINRDTHPDLVL